MSREIKFKCLITDKGKVVSHFTEWLDGDGWKHDYYSPLVTNGVFSHEELGDGFLGDIIRKQFTGLRDKSTECLDIYEDDILSSMGIIIGNKYENRSLLEEKTNLLIEGFGTKKWRVTEKEAMDRGCAYAE